MAKRSVTLHDPARFRDPHGLTWERYVAMQAKERERYMKARSELPPEAFEFKLCDGRYLEHAREDQFLNNYFPELYATRYLATVVRKAPFEELKKCALCQMMDEQRHMEMDREVLELAGVPEDEWLPRWRRPGTTYRFFEHILCLEDPIEILMKANFVGETAAGPGTFKALADGARKHGDPLSAVNHEGRLRDEARHGRYATELARALVDEDPSNLEVLQEWQDEALELFSDVGRDGERREWWEGFVSSYYKVATPMGLRRTPVPF